MMVHIDMWFKFSGRMKMFHSDRQWKLWVMYVLVSFALTGCGLLGGNSVDTDPSATATPTQVGDVVGSPLENETESPCRGLSGTLELEILVGPAEAVDLPPTSVGRIPFSVVEEGNTFLVEGEGSLDYYQEVLGEAWGTYTVTFEADSIITGTCENVDDEPMLNLILTLSGISQNVVVVYDGIPHEFQWSGERADVITLPLIEGASQQGEGWVVILHLDN